MRCHDTAIFQEYFHHGDIAKLLPWTKPDELCLVKVQFLVDLMPSICQVLQHQWTAILLLMHIHVSCNVSWNCRHSSNQSSAVTLSNVHDDGAVEQKENCLPSTLPYGTGPWHSTSKTNSLPAVRNEECNPVKKHHHEFRRWCFPRLAMCWKFVML